ncbi:MAG: bifunctional phosphoribosyl-AMP cyclohydrolase/phosphoribosyl-ATP diphosphatase HisIE [Gemmatimonadales bacterium]|nr:bifunctional phosphoribosyl-AMP cyclohydrolase/phosphoribosyl-ATP diphosphatase HisIE [Gemmatimonadota bacterium]MCC7131374.1 bifunctional phosphoribosyl-AMP cyclohydrolase/phosphoribosyl-ATP diphosphatase HisIE [Gemmatimonadales bacterium]MDX2056460.1 bifunctional phosphoribosyl-AMP cyclohydrolase/phosphoribosyl-ATP diphosphatase HisIE [Gemmatimonadales bacterium]
MKPLDLDRLDFAKGGGLVTVVTQDIRTGEVLMVAHADREALEKTVATGQMHYRSRSRGLWHKGATSGNTQRVLGLLPDCDGDTVLALVDPAGPACHTGQVSCFGEVEREERATGFDDRGILDRLDATIAIRASEPGTGSSYTARLLADRNLRLKKLGEEAGELAVACADGNAGRATEEAADLIYHLLVAVRPLGVSLADIRAALARRER